MYPFNETYDADKDLLLVKQACEGSRAAMEKLVKTHQRFIYNIALKLVRDADDAADLTQEVLIKMITKLTLYNQTSSFRTWLYRIVTNHFISMKRKKAEKDVYSFSELGIYVDEIHHDEDMSTEEQVRYSEHIKHVRNNCMSSMLLCLSRQQRIVFVLGGVFNLKSNVAAEILNITPENFRKQYSRAKADLFQFMDNKCGLINPDNPCRCFKKTKGFIAEGKINPDTQTFTEDFKQSILSVSASKNDNLDTLMEGRYLRFFTSQNYEDTDVAGELIKTLLFDPEIKRLFHLN